MEIYGKKLFIKLIKEVMLPYMETQGFKKKGVGDFVRSGTKGIEYFSIDGRSTRYSNCEFNIGTYFPKYRRYYKELFDDSNVVVQFGFLTIRAHPKNNTYFEELGIPQNIGSLYGIEDLDQASEIAKTVFNKVALPYYQKVNGLLDFRNEQLRDFKEDISDVKELKGEITWPHSSQVLEILVITKIFEPEKLKDYWDLFLEIDPLTFNKAIQEIAINGLKRIKPDEAKELLKSEK
ncbi:hypothetical protein [uncultured Arcticibacterium sp.]|uniref:hypothetical protein n=1 Tax=uncultured Arcticibacterium sp. TaxID=2173042 RepID=UPI0030FB8EC5